MSSRFLVAIIVPLSIASACSRSNAGAPSSGGGADTTRTDTAGFVAIPADTSAAAAARAAQAAQPQAADACRIVPLDTAAQLMQQALGKPVRVATPRGSGNCTYRDVPTGTPAVTASIDIGHEQTAASAGTTLFMLRSQEGAAGTATTDLTGIGDNAFGASDTTGTYTVKTQRGPWVVQVVVKAPQANTQALRAGASALARSAISVLP